MKMAKNYQELTKIRSKLVTNDGCWKRDYLKYARWKKHIKPGFILLIKPGFKFNLKLGLKYYIKPTVLSCGGAAMKVRLG